jgi:hypothetical protein
MRFAHLKRIDLEPICERTFMPIRTQYDSWRSPSPVHVAQLKHAAFSNTLRRHARAQ